MIRLFNKKGSLTIEAAITVPIFICLVSLFIFSIKIVYTNLLINEAVKETTKKIATTAYPLALLNEFEDEYMIGEDIPEIDEEIQKVKGYFADSAQGLMSKLLEGQVDKSYVGDIAKGVGKSILKDYTGGIVNALVGSSRNNYIEIKSELQYKYTKSVLLEFLNKYGVDNKAIEVICVEFPKSQEEYNFYNEDNKEEYQEKMMSCFGGLPDKDDVAVCVNYKPRIPIPYFSDKVLSFDFWSLERAWIYGSNGVYTVLESQESAVEEGKKETIEEQYKKTSETKVYTTKVGIRYHKKGCRYLAKSMITRTQKDATGLGYTACKVCKP